MNPFKLLSHTLRNDSEGSYLEYHFEESNLFIKSPADFPLAVRAETLICALLMPAMQLKTLILIPQDLNSSESFLDNIGRLQDIFSTWYPTLSKVDVDASTVIREHAEFEARSALFFSGGIDAMYSLLRHRDEINYLVYVRGIDMQLEQEVLWQQCLKLNSNVAALFEKQLVPVESNIRFFIRSICSPELGWNLTQGTGLAALAHALPFARMDISSSNTYGALHPFGSHPLSDPLFSSDRLQIRHLGCEARRHEKLMEISKYPELLPHLRVCWQDKGFNCGHCDKCLHFRMALRLLGLEAGGLKPIDDLALLADAHTATEGEFREWEDNLVLADKTGDTKAIRALRKALNRYKKRQIFRLVDDVYAGGRLTALKNRLFTTKG